MTVAAPALQIGQRLEQRHDVERQRRLRTVEADLARQHHHLQQIGRRVGHADDVGAARAPDPQRAQRHLQRARGRHVADRRQRAGGGELAREQRLARVAVERLVVVADAAHAQELGDGGAVRARLLAQVERHQIQPEDLRPQRQRPDLGGRRAGQADAAEPAR